MHRRDAGDQLGQDDRLAESGPAEQPDLAAADERRQQVDDLDARLELLGLGREGIEGRRVAMDGPVLFRVDRAAAIDRVAEQVEHAAECLLADRNAHGVPGIGHRHAADQPFGRAQGHAADPIAAEVLLDLAGQVDLHALDVAHDLQGIINVRQVSFPELGIEGRADHLGNSSGHRRGSHRS